MIKKKATVGIQLLFYLNARSILLILLPKLKKQYLTEDYLHQLLQIFPYCFLVFMRSGNGQ